MAREPLNFVAENVRFLLWKEKRIKRESWVPHLSRSLGCPPERALQMLQNGTLNPAETDRVAELFDVSPEDLTVSRLIERENLSILRENLRFLLGELRKGQKKELARAAGVHATTISRWVSGANSPGRDHLAALLRFSGLPAHTDLQKQPLFLSLTPLSDRARREWLHQQIEKMDSNQLSDLFPALQKLLGD